MNKTLLIAKREFRAAILSKAFVISLLTLPIMLAASIGLPSLIERFKSTETRAIVIVDRTPGSGVEAEATLIRLRDRDGSTVASDAEAERVEDEGDTGTGRPGDGAGGPGGEPASGSRTAETLSRLRFETVRGTADPEETLRLHHELGQRVSSGELAAFFDIGPDALAPVSDDPERAAISYFTDRALDRELLMGVGANLVAIVQLQRSASQNPLLFLRKERRYTPDEIASLLSAAAERTAGALVRRELPKRDADGTLVAGKKVESAFKVILPIGGALLLFVSVLLVASPQLQGVIEEKMNRIGEVLLGSATPFQLLSGKLLGMTGTDLVLAFVYGGGGLLAARHWGLVDDIGWVLPIWFLVFQVLAMLLFGSLFIAVGSACNDMKEAQNLLMPVSILLSLPMIFLPAVMEDPTGGLARFVSLVPFATPPLMLCRLAATSNLPIWEPVLGVVLMIATTVVSIWVASRIFRIGYLSTGKAPTTLELVRWIFSRS